MENTVHVKFRLICLNNVINCFTGSYKKDKICYQDFHLPRHFPTVEVSLPRHSYQKITRIGCFPTKTFSLFRHFQILDNVYCTCFIFLFPFSHLPLMWEFFTFPLSSCILSDDLNNIFTALSKYIPNFIPPNIYDWVVPFQVINV